MAGAAKAGIAGAGKNGAVAFAQDKAAVAVEQVYAGAPPKLQGVAAFVGQRLPFGNKIIPVGSRFCVKTGVEIRAGFCGFQYPHVAGQESVQGRDKAFRFDACNAGVKIRRLGGGMYAGVGAAGTGKIHRMAVHLREGAFDDGLDGSFPAALFLPAAEICSVVGYYELDRPHAG